MEIRVDHARLKVLDRLQLKAIRMKAKADGITVDQFGKAVSKQTRELYRKKLMPTKLGPVNAYRDESGRWRADDLWRGSEVYTLRRVLEENLYVHIRGYLMGLILSDIGKGRKEWQPETVTLRGDKKVAIVKQGKLKLHSEDDWLRMLKRRKGKRTTGS